MHTHKGWLCCVWRSQSGNTKGHSFHCLISILKIRHLSFITVTVATVCVWRFGWLTFNLTNWYQLLSGVWAVLHQIHDTLFFSSYSRHINTLGGIHTHTGFVCVHRRKELMWYWWYNSLHIRKQVSNYFSKQYRLLRRWAVALLNHNICWSRS